MSDYINFREISNKINFNQLLNWLNIPYTEKNGELKGEVNGFKFIINTSKNLFFSPDNASIKGSVINFYATISNKSLRDTALELAKQFLVEPTAPKREIPNLELHYTSLLESMFKIPKEFVEPLEVGLVHQKSIMSGRIAFKCYDENNNHVGYVGWHPKKEDWYYPANFIRPLYNFHRLLNKERIVLVANPFDCLYLISIGLVSVALLGDSMNDKQEELLKNNCKQVCVLHRNPDNIVHRLYSKCFVKAPVLTKPIKDYSVEEIVAA
ncbi:MAG: hypothetical protein V1779_17760 [bacterium]